MFVVKKNIVLARTDGGAPRPGLSNWNISAAEPRER